MKIQSGRGVTPTGGPRRTGASSGASDFTPAVDGAQKLTGASGAAPVASLDAILALQSEEGPSERGARQARRGQAALDALEELEKALLLGRAPAALANELQRLRAGGERTGHSDLDAILLEIDTRVAVELAKLEKMQAPA